MVIADLVSGLHFASVFLLPIQIIYFVKIQNSLLVYYVLGGKYTNASIFLHGINFNFDVFRIDAKVFHIVFGIKHVVMIMM